MAGYAINGYCLSPQHSSFAECEFCSFRQLSLTAGSPFPGLLGLRSGFRNTLNTGIYLVVGASSPQCMDWGERGLRPVPACPASTVVQPQGTEGSGRGSGSFLAFNAGAEARLDALKSCGSFPRSSYLHRPHSSQICHYPVLLQDCACS